MLQHIPEVQALIDSALSEDQAFNDPTTRDIVPQDLRGMGVLKAKAAGVLAGVDVSLAVFQRMDPDLQTEALSPDGSRLELGDIVARVSGRACSILQAERTALNLLQRMSGIATATARYVEAVEGLGPRIIDTRKTAPGMRYLDKYAVRAGGGFNHRQNLADGILIKDNHIRALRSLGISLKETVEMAIGLASHTIKVEVEVTNLEELEDALAGGAHIIMLDNMTPEEMRRCVQIVDGRAVIEASGGINMDSVRAVAETGVDLISVGGLTHSPDALDISLDLVFEQ
ncbi:MAG: carboxylating nicotinate-nucleotide diphosphorylase [Dehalococcoidia bacterium]|nr:carboxylating nicotinate-nucleotide diphosphorylase [Dehalococcoidia bacterium]